MSKPSIVKTSADANDEKPLRRADTAAGKLVLRKRGATGAVLPNASGYFSTGCDPGPLRPVGVGSSR